MTTAQNVKRRRRDGRLARTEAPAPGVPYTMKLSDGRTVFVEVPGRLATRDRGGDLAFTPEGVRFLDRLRALSLQPGPTPSPAFLSRLRESLGLTQAQLGRLIGRNKLTISRWECGTLHPSPEAVEKLYALARQRKQAGVVLAG